eukprot:XP_001705262.1 Hypothetical protein GL50803_19005 [Giardia lamblia ATCC 50803]
MENRRSNRRSRGEPMCFGDSALRVPTRKRWKSSGRRGSTSLPLQNLASFTRAPYALRICYVLRGEREAREYLLTPGCSDLYSILQLRELELALHELAWQEALLLLCQLAAHGMCQSWTKCLWNVLRALERGARLVSCLLINDGEDASDVLLADTETGNALRDWACSGLHCAEA